MKNIGYTLIEFIIVLIIIGILAAGASGIIFHGSRGYIRGQNINNADWQARVAIERLARDLHAVNTAKSIDSANSTNSQIAFTDVYGNSITYMKSGTQLLRNNQPLADGVQSFTINYYTSTGASISPLTSASILLTNYLQAQISINYNSTIINTSKVIYLWN